MANINLATNSAAADKKIISYNAGLMTALGILIVLIVGYVAIVFIGKSTQAKTAEAESQYGIEHQKLITGNKDIVDFQNRLVVAKDLVPQESVGYSSLPAVEKAMLPGIFLKNFNYDQAQRTLSVDGVTDNFDMLAKQILSFKESEYFSAVTTGATSIDTGGKVNFTLKLKIK